MPKGITIGVREMHPLEKIKTTAKNNLQSIVLPEPT